MKTMLICTWLSQNGECNMKFFSVSHVLLLILRGFNQKTQNRHCNSNITQTRTGWHFNEDSPKIDDQTKPWNFYINHVQPIIPKSKITLFWSISNFHSTLLVWKYMILNYLPCTKLADDTLFVANMKMYFIWMQILRRYFSVSLAFIFCYFNQFCGNIQKLIRVHTFSKYAKCLEKLAFLTLRWTHVFVRIGGKKIVFGKFRVWTNCKIPYFQWVSNNALIQGDLSFLFNLLILQKTRFF